MKMNTGHFNNITFQQMEALIHLVEECNFSRAAQKMHITGKILYNYARRIAKLRAEAAQKISTLPTVKSSNIYLAASTIPATYILPPALSAFRKIHSEIKVYAKTADTHETINAVLDKEAEIGCVGKKPLNGKLAVDVLWQDRLVLAVPCTHKWSSKKSITLTEMSKEPFVIRERGSATRYVVEEYLKKTKEIRTDDLNICCELGSSEAIKEAILAGLGVSIISRHAIRRELAAGTHCEVFIKGMKMERNFYLIHLLQTEFSPAHKIFADFLKKFSPEK